MSENKSASSEGAAAVRNARARRAAPMTPSVRVTRRTVTVALPIEVSGERGDWLATCEAARVFSAEKTKAAAIRLCKARVRRWFRMVAR